MMLVSDAFKRLSYGLLSNLSMSNDGSGEIADNSKNKLVGYMNDALDRLYTRFCLLEREVMLRQYLHITQYHLDKRFAVENPDRPSSNYPYILDLPAEPFSDDAVKILEVYDEAGCRLPLNDADDFTSLFTPYPTTLQVPNPKDGRPLSVRYQAIHPTLEFGAYTTEIKLPAILESPFLTLVAHFVFSHMNSAESTVKGQEHFATYERLCAEIEGKGNAEISGPSTSNKFQVRGFC